MSDSVIDNGGGADSNGQSIAVVGMAGRFPKARNLDELWRNVREGRECVSRFSAEEIEEAGVPEAVRTAPNFVPARAILEEPFSFDAPFFGYTPTEAKLTDPQHRLFLECAWEALEHAGYDPAKYPDLVGVYAGADVNTYAIGNILLWTHDLQSLIGNDKDYLSTRVSFKLNLRGPSLTVQTACSTSLVAVQLACQGLLGYQCDLALAGGVGIAFPQKAGYVYHQGSILSPDGHCRPFDARAKGTVGGDGLGLVVLKRLDDALRDGDTIHAVIRGAAINNDGALKVGFTAPSVQGQAEVIAMAQAMAGVSPETITYVEAHGTATELGDPVEIAALTDVFRAGTDKKQFCALGSLKGNVGHMNSAAGVGGLLKTILALGHKELPPSINHEAANPIIDFTGSPFFVNTRLRPWETDGHPRRAGVSSFGVGGTNAHVVLEEAPALRPSGPSRAKQLVVLSAKTESALKAMAANFTEHLGAHPELSLADVAYTLTVGRQLFKYRRMAVCGTLEEARAAFSADLPVTGREPRKPQVVFMFPGQGAQRVDMARELYDSEPTFRDAVDGCAERLRPLLGLDPRTVLYPPAERREEASRRILQTELAQPALFVIEYALAHLWMSWGVTPDAMIGHSVGEYVAACLAEVISLEDALALVAARGRLMQKLPSGAMLAVALSEEEAGKLRSVSVAAVNAPGMVVLSGTHAAIDEVARELQSRGVPATKLHTSHAFHSEMMDPILDELRAVVGKVALSEPRIPYVSNLTGTWISAAEATDPGYWVRHLRQPVRFGAGVAELLAEPDRVLLEVGPGRALSSFAKKHGPNVHERVFTSLEPSRDGASDLESFLHALGRLY
ncbi:MAG TPA: type I polyketide synthase, partial [Longimicrobium sp.]|nr:type I polyketide synthase [Longimicrobium sp.]